jgi:hypothetical protein
VNLVLAIKKQHLAAGQILLVILKAHHLTVKVFLQVLSLVVVAKKTLDREPLDTEVAAIVATG